MSTFSVASHHTSDKEISTHTLQNAAELIGRIMLATIFLIAGAGKISAYAGTAGYMASMGVPGALLPLVIATELLGGIAIIVGYRTRLVAFLMAGFTMLAALFFHHNFADQIQMIMFLKNVAITGAFLLLVVHGAGHWSLDHKSGRQ